MRSRLLYQHGRSLDWSFHLSKVRTTFANKSKRCFRSSETFFIALSYFIANYFLRHLVIPSTHSASGNTSNPLLPGNQRSAGYAFVGHTIRAVLEYIWTSSSPAIRVRRSRWLSLFPLSWLLFLLLPRWTQLPYAVLGTASIL